MPGFPALHLGTTDSSGAKALPPEDNDFDFHLVEPASRVWVLRER
jgi:hypothetical protein